MAVRTEELAGAVTAWHQQGGHVAMATLTMRHRRGGQLATLWDAKADAWSAVVDTSALRRPRAGSALERGNLAGYCHRTEVTDGANGWHVHVHALVFLRDGSRADAAAALAEWKDAATAAWTRRLSHRDGLTPSAEHGVHATALLRPGREAEDCARYVAKDAPDEIARELTGELGKVGRRGNRTQWQTLAAAMAGDRTAIARWAEWETASKGRRALVWTKALRRELVVGDVEDEQAAEDEQRTTILVSVHGQEYRRLRVSGLGLDVLEAAEDAMAWATDAGHTHHEALQAAQDGAVHVLALHGVPEHRMTIPAIARGPT